MDNGGKRKGPQERRQSRCGTHTRCLRDDKTSRGGCEKTIPFSIAIANPTFSGERGTKEEEEKESRVRRR